MLHLQSVDASGNILSDVLESTLSTSQAAAIAAIQQQIPGLLPPHVLSNSEKFQLLSEEATIVSQGPTPSFVNVGNGGAGVLIEATDSGASVPSTRRSP